LKKKLKRAAHHLKLAADQGFAAQNDTLSASFSRFIKPSFREGEIRMENDWLCM
jgi:hypothetical protein